MPKEDRDWYKEWFDGKPRPRPVECPYCKHAISVHNLIQTMKVSK